MTVCGLTENERSRENRAYCMNWAERFLSKATKDRIEMKFYDFVTGSDIVLDSILATKL